MPYECRHTTLHDSQLQSVLTQHTGSVAIEEHEVSSKLADYVLEAFLRRESPDLDPWKLDTETVS